MYRSLTIESFRSFRKLTLSGLRRMNLFVGPNNAGKTSILEAFFLHACGPQLKPFLQIPLKKRAGRFRGAEDLGVLLRQLFRADSLALEFRLSATREETTCFTHEMELPFAEQIEPEEDIAPSGERTIARWKVRLNEEGPQALQIDFRGNVRPVRPPFTEASWLDPMLHQDRLYMLQIFVSLLRAERTPELMKHVQVLFPDLTSIEQIPFPSGEAGNLFLRRRDGKRMEVSSFGDGMRRWLLMLMHLLDSKGELHCMDDIDAALHPYLEPKITRHLLHLLHERNQQIVASTHNLEFIDALLRSAYEEGLLKDEATDPIAIYTLRLDENGDHHVRRRSGREAYEARDEVSAELRA